MIMCLKKLNKKNGNYKINSNNEKIAKRHGVIIDTDFAFDWIGENINGPTVVRLHGSFKKKIGFKFLLLFAHHEGEFIRLLGSNSIIDRWRLIPEKLLDLKRNFEFHDHVASPDAHYLKKKNELIIFFHSRELGSRDQKTYIASFRDSLSVSPSIYSTNLPFYARIFLIKGVAYALTKGGNLFEAADMNLRNWTPLINIFTGQGSLDDIYQNQYGSVRHLCVVKHKNTHLVFYTIIGDSPEKIWASRLIVDQTKGFYSAIGKTLILLPSENYEGSQIDLKNSKSGPSLFPENAVRDPFVYKSRRNYFLFYSIKGEFGIALASLNIKSIIKELG